MILTLLAWLFVGCPFFVLLCMPPLFTTAFNCAIFSDSFSSNDISNYDQRSGSWSIGTGVIQTTSSSGIIVANATSATGNGRALVTAQNSVAGGTIGLIGAWVDDNNYLKLQITVQDGSPTTTPTTIDLYQRSGGTDTLLKSESLLARSGTNVTFEMCWDGTNVTAGLFFVGGTTCGINFTVSCSATGNQAGFFASPNGGTAVFDDFSFAQNSADAAADAPCTACSSNCCSCCSNGIQMMQMVTTGFTNGSCSSCSSLNGTYVSVLGTGSCDFVPNGSVPGTCGTTTLQTDFISSSGTPAKVKATSVLRFGTAQTFTWINNDIGVGNSPGDCTAISNVNVPLFTISSPGGVVCNGAPTMHISSL